MLGKVHGSNKASSTYKFTVKNNKTRLSSMVLFTSYIGMLKAIGVAEKIPYKRRMQRILFARQKPYSQMTFMKTMNKEGFVPIRDMTCINGAEIVGFRTTKKNE